MTFPATPLNILVEIELGGVWTNITSYTLGRDSIHITRGRANEYGLVEASTCTLTLNNRDGRFSPRNPTSPYYGNLGRNTPIRVSLPDLTTDDFRFYGEVSSWPQKWDKTGTDVYTTIEASGIMRRLSQGNTVALAAYKDYLISTNPRAYWALDDGKNSTKAPSDTPFNNSAMFRYGDLGKAKFGEGDLGTTLPPGLQMNGSASGVAIKGEVNSLNVITDAVLDFVFRSGSLDQTLSVNIARTDDSDYTLELRADGTNNDLRLRYIDPDNNITNIGDTGALTIYSDGALHHIRLSLVESGADTLWTIYVDGVSSANGTHSSINVKGTFRISFTMTAASSSPVALGHVAYWNTNGDGDDPPAIATVINALTGYSGETAAARMSRLCTDAGITFTLTGTAADTPLMGPQPDEKTVLELLRECEAADAGVLYEDRDGFGLIYRTRMNLYNQSVVATLDYDAAVFGEVPEPVDDDQLTRNDVTVSREGGDSARATKTSGPLSTLDPPDGVGPYEHSTTVNVQSDAQLDGLANWLMNLGTLDLSRYPVIVLNLARTVFTTNATLTQNVATLDVGDHFHVTNLPDWLPPDDVHLLAQGFTETLGNFEWQIETNNVPGILYEPAKFSSAVAGTDRFDAQGSELTNAITSGQTSFQVTNTEQTFWTTNGSEMPFDILVGGERMTVTAISTLPILVGVGTAAQANNASVTPGLPASVASGDRVFIFASIRSSGVGTVNLPANWTNLINNANCRLMYRDYDGVWTMPTITFTGGAAGDDTLAQSAAFRGIITDLSTGSLLNGSAQDIAFAGADLTASSLGLTDLFLALGWKQDDWTSVAPMTLVGNGLTYTMTEIQENSSILGNDAAQVWDYIIQGPSNIADTSFVVTGGAAAISRRFFVLFRTAHHTFTVTRSVNGIVKSHVAGTDVKLFKTPTYGL